jgi:hypothetical protein
MSISAITYAVAIAMITLSLSFTLALTLAVSVTTAVTFTIAVMQIPCHIFCIQARIPFFSVTIGGTSDFRTSLTIFIFSGRPIPAMRGRCRRTVALV